MSQIRERDKAIANANSVSLAYLISTVRGLGGAKEEIDLERLLPYPSPDPKVMTRETAIVIARLMDKKMFDQEVLQAMGVKHLDAVSKI